MTEISRKKLAVQFVDKVFEKVSERKGYKFRPGKHGPQPFMIEMDGTDVGFETTLAKELSWLCKELGRVIELILKSIL